MTATKKKTKIALPPVPLNDPAMLEVINKGGSVRAPETPTKAEDSETAEDILKSFTFKIYESELAQIREILSRTPKRDRLSIHDFVLAAVKDKINKDKKKTTN